MPQILVTLLVGVSAGVLIGLLYMFAQARRGETDADPPRRWGHGGPGDGDAL